MLPNAKTTVFPTSAEELTPGPTHFRPSIVYADVGGTINVIPADGDGTTIVPFAVKDCGVVPVMVVAVTSVTGASGLKRIF